jgi:hypothetical protein
MVPSSILHEGRNIQFQNVFVEYLMMDKVQEPNNPLMHVLTLT